MTSYLLTPKYFTSIVWMISKNSSSKYLKKGDLLSNFVTIGSSGVFLHGALPPD